MNDITERDLRHPDFRDGDPEDYERRGDGKIVRKDRWERGMRDIAGLMVGSRSDFEIPDVVKQVRDLLDTQRPKRSDQDIVGQTEELARKLASMDGYVLEGSFRTADSARGKHFWQMACRVQEMLTDTDVQNAVDNLEERCPNHV